MFSFGTIIEETVTPGSQVSVDLYGSHEKGYLSTSPDKEPEAIQYPGCTIIFDHASCYIFEHTFESFCNTHGLSIQKYITNSNPLNYNK